MPSGGKLTIETGSADLGVDYPRQHPEARPGPHVVLAVSDTGGGMDQATQQHIFEPFFTTKAASQGTGLGLAAVYGIVKQSGGSIEVYSELDRGTTFKISLPKVARMKTRDAKTFSPGSDASPGEKKKIVVLVVDDETPVREVLIEALAAEGLDAAL